MAHFESFHSNEVTGFSGPGGDAAEREGGVVVDDSDCAQTVDDQAEKKAMDLDDTEDNEG